VNAGLPVLLTTKAAKIDLDTAIYQFDTDAAIGTIQFDS
jgi:hypothetical protein